MAHDHVHSAVLSAMSSATPLPSNSMAMNMPMSTSSSATVHTSTPSASAAPVAHAEPKGWRGNIDLAAGFLAILILFIILLFVFFAYAIYQRVRKGKCPNCKDLEATVQLYEDGKLPITIPMVRARDALNAASNGANVDLERGTADPDASIEAEAPFWARAKGKVVKLGKQFKSRMPATCADTAQPSTDRFFTIGGTPYTHTPPGSRDSFIEPAHPAPIYQQFTINEPDPFDDDVSHAGPSRPRSMASAYSQSTYHTNRTTDVSALDTRQFRESWANDRQARRSSANLEVPRPFSTALNLSDPRHLARYEEAQNIIAKGDVPDHEMQKAVRDLNAIEDQKRERIRYGGYGGLPHPDDVPLADVRGDGKNAAKSRDSYVAPQWRSRGGGE